jgi:integrase
VPQLSANSVTIRDGKIVLTQRKNSSAWQARFRVGNRWLRVTTKHAELEKAKDAAYKLFERAQIKNEEGLPVVSKRFSQVSAIAKQKMQAALDAGEAKRVYVDYIAAINNYLDPFFGKYNITSIDYALMKEFAAWRTAKQGHEAKASTISTHNSALNRIFDEAMERGYMTKSQVPELKNKGVKSERRPAFTIDEYRKLYRFMRGWVKKGQNGKSRWMRELLRDYVLILANTGMRHGTESYGLKWKNISYFNDKGRQYVLMHVNGKTGPRELVARHNVVPYLQRIHKRTDDIKDLSFDELISKGMDKEVFRLPDGTKTQSLAQTFEILLKDADLLFDSNTEQARTLYSLRHTYATFGLVKAGMEIHLLAAQMGTSVAMIEKHYSHLKPRMRARELAGYNFLFREEAKG